MGIWVRAFERIFQQVNPPQDLGQTGPDEGHGLNGVTALFGIAGRDPVVHAPDESGK